jgi:hypothetical protein
MMKVFGCRQAYENRPCTNRRAGGDGLWGFRVSPGRGDGSTGAANGVGGDLVSEIFRQVGPGSGAGCG